MAMETMVVAAAVEAQLAHSLPLPTWKHDAVYVVRMASDCWL